MRWQWLPKSEAAEWLRVRMEGMRFNGAALSVVIADVLPGNTNQRRLMSQKRDIKRETHLDCVDFATATRCFSYWLKRIKEKELA